MRAVWVALVVALGLSVGAPPETRAAAAEAPVAVTRGPIPVEAGRLRVTRIGAFRPRRNPTLRAAIRAFGRPSSRRLGPRYVCVAGWRRLGLRIRFVYLGALRVGQTTCTPSVGRAQEVEITGRRFRTWRGLRVGMHARRVPELHPAAERIDRDTWWLRRAFSPIAAGRAYPVVTAEIGRRGRVASMAGYIGAAGD